MENVKTDNGLNPSKARSDLSREVRHAMDEVSSSVSELARDTVKQAKHLGERAFEDVKSMTRSQAQSLESQVKGHPLSSVAIALGVGFLFGALLRR